MSCFLTCSMTTCGAAALWASDAVSWICARYPASVIASTFRRRTRAASCDTAMPTMNNTANVVTSDEVRMVNRPYGTVKKVKPDPCPDRRQGTGQPVADRGHRDDHHYQEQRDVRVRPARPPGHQDGRCGQGK